MLLSETSATTYSKMKIGNLKLLPSACLAYQELSQIFQRPAARTRRRTPCAPPRWFRRSDAGAPSSRSIAVRASKQKPKLEFRTRRTQQTWLRADPLISARATARIVTNDKTSMLVRGHDDVEGGPSAASRSAARWEPAAHEVLQLEHRNKN